MLKALLWSLLATRALAQDSTVLQGTRSVGTIDANALPTDVTYLDYGTSIIYVTGSLTEVRISSTPTGSVSTTRTSSSNSTTTTAPSSSALVGTVTQGNATASSTQSANRPTNTVPCNGHPEFCNRKYSNITMITAHNSPFHVASNLASNQEFGVISQLNDGVRMVQGQVHFVNGVPHLCHTSCDLLDAGPLEDWLKNITDWLEGNMNDVVTVLIGNGNYTPIEQYTSAIQSSGIVPYAYIPPQIPMNLTSWPTIGEMILSGKRAVIFMDYEADQTKVPYVLDEFSQLSETPFDPVDPSFPCYVQRPPNLSNKDAQNRLYMVNHNLNAQVNLLGLSVLVPNLSNIAITNGIDGYTSAGLTANHCITNFTRPPNFINVDYYNRGDPYNGSIFQVAAQQNKVTYNHDNCCGKSQAISAASRLLSTNTGAFAAAMALLVGAMSLL